MNDEGDSLWFIDPPGRFAYTSRWRRHLANLLKCDQNNWQVQRAIFKAMHEIEMRKVCGFRLPQYLSPDLNRIMVFDDRP